MILESTLEVIRKEVERQTGTICTQISVDSNREIFQVWASLHDNSGNEFMVEWEVEKDNLPKEDFDYLKVIISGLVNDYLVMLRDVATVH